MKGRLNVFQTTMLRWRALHPYNAVHAVRVPHALDVARLESGIAGVLRAAGLTGLALDCRRSRYEFCGGAAAVKVRVVGAGGDPREALRQEFEHEINTGFGSSPALDPFRFFVVDAGPFFHLGLAYDHFIAGGDSIVELMKRIVELFSPRAEAAAAAPPVPRWAVHSNRYARLLLRRIGSVLAGMPRLPRLISASREAFRPPRFTAANTRNSVFLFELDAKRTQALFAAAARWEVSLNDLLLALLLRGLLPLTAGRTGESRRKRVAVASILNIRQELAAPVAERFGQFLGSLQISHPLPDGVSLERLAREVHEQTAEIRHRRLYLQTLLALAFNGLVWRYLSSEQRHGFYAKHYPVWAGISTLSVKRQFAHAAPGALDYLRIASTGPLAPMVFAVTVGHDVLEIGITYRTGIITEPAIRAMTEDLVAAVDACCA